MTSKEMEAMVVAMRAELDELSALPEVQQFKRSAEERRINLDSARREQEISRKREAERLEALRQAVEEDPLVRVTYEGAGGSGVILSMRGEQFHEAWSWGVRSSDHNGVGGTHARLPTAHHYRKSDWRQVMKESDGEIKRLIREGLLNIAELDANDVIASGELRTRWARSRVREAI